MSCNCFQWLPSCWVSPWTPGRSPQGQEPTGQMWLMESGLDSCVWLQFSNGDIKNPDITSSLFHQKKRLSPCKSLQRTNSCWLCGLGGSRKRGRGKLGSSPHLGGTGQPGLSLQAWDWLFGNHDNSTPRHCVGP